MPPKLSYMALPVDPSFACIDDEAEEGGETEDDEEEDAAEVTDDDEEQEEEADQEAVIELSNQWMQQQQKQQQAASSSSSSSSADIHVKHEEGGADTADPHAWILDGTWVTEGDDNWSNWDRASDSIKVKAEQVSQSRVGEGSGQIQQQANQFSAAETAPIAAAAVVQHTAPPWAYNKSANPNSHLRNNQIKDGSRGSYGFDDNGNQIFLATGHGAFAAGLGRDRPRHRGKGSKAKQRAKTNQDKGKGKAKGKGKSKDKGGSKGDHHFVAAQGQVTQALDTMATMAQSTQQLVTMLAKDDQVKREDMKTEPKSEPGYDDYDDADDGWSRSSKWQRRW
jgi:hypothetical protein